MNSWYEIVDSTKNITQGDILFNCPLFIPIYPSDELTSEDIERLKEEDTIIDSEVFFQDIIVLNQACDLEVREGKDAPKLKMVLVAPLQNVRKSSVPKKHQISIAKLNKTELFLLEPCFESVKMEYQLINFDDVITIPWKLLNAYSRLQEQRLRMKSPYIEHLSQHLANHFGRVGIPENREESLVKFHDYKNEYEARRSQGEFSVPWTSLNDAAVFDFIQSIENV